MNSTDVIRGLLDSVEEELRAVQARLDELKVERQGLTLALRRLPSTETVVAPAPVVRTPLLATPPSDDAYVITLSNPWLRLSKVEAVKRVLAEASAPMTPSEIADYMVQAGLPRNEGTTSVRGTLNHLKKRGEVRLLGRGQWVLVGGLADPGDTETPAATGVSVGVPTSGAGGDSGAPPQANRDHGDTHTREDRGHDYGASVDEPPF